MWMRFPRGVDHVNCQLQDFKTEAKDKDGRGYFRVPNHFAPILLNINGFEVAEPPEGTDLTDLPQSDPLRDGAIAELTARATGAIAELASVRADLNATMAKLHAEQNDKNNALNSASVLAQENEALRARLDEFESAQQTAEALAADKKKK